MAVGPCAYHPLQTMVCIHTASTGSCWEGMGAMHVNTAVRRTSLVAPWLRLCASTAGGTGLFPGQGSFASPAEQPKQNKNMAVRSTHSSQFWSRNLLTMYCVTLGKRNTPLSSVFPIYKRWRPISQGRCELSDDKCRLVPTDARCWLNNDLQWMSTPSMKLPATNWLMIPEPLWSICDPHVAIWSFFFRAICTARLQIPWGYGVILCPPSLSAPVASHICLKWLLKQPSTDSYSHNRLHLVLLLLGVS